ncbi:MULTISPECIES: sulfate/molybdate ABC transporter ATP-binding protein [Flavobacteriaceae]|uniref:ATP-binding cassette domain-containing protein n=2 Tax=Flavobacteriaceae TaxID=49546 RepID=A0A4Y8AUT6_9FLAO|nr:MULTISPECIES: ATP-binding cassette domain-containing protein [Flavobacteriaceae]TEW75142.1 ATP-binding cassette domain-containing protein [Gramella jeungdoensis]GGK41247.1 GTPase [Lutibacter litoralis]
MIEISIQKKLTAALGEMLLDINTTINKGSLVTLYGKSGVGKTTILRILAGLLYPDSGKIIVNGDTWLNTTTKINLKPQKRKVGFVFQDYALFPNMNVKENLLFALNKGQNSSIVNHLIEIIELGELQHRKPDTLSGGQKQRVALARALVQKPSILMLDEPLSALDAEIRFKLQQYILAVHKEYNLTTLLISHDISEILRMSDKVLELEHGKIVRQGTPNEVFNHKELNAKFQFTGTIIEIEKQDFLFILTVRIGKDLVKVVADESEGAQLIIGDKILVSSKAFNPIIHKIG